MNADKRRYQLPCLLAAALFLATALPAAHAQTAKWPDKPVRMIVPLAPGGGTIGSGPSSGAHIRAGRLRALGVTTAKRSPSMPDLPAIGEMFPGYSSDFWFGIWAPAGTPAAVISRLNQALGRILRLPEVQERLRTDSMQAVGSTPDEFARAIDRDIATWTKVVKAGNIRLD